MNIKPHKLVILLFALLLPLQVGADALERARTNNSLTLGYLPNLAPFSSEEGGKVEGYAIELCLKIADRVEIGLGLSDMQVRYQATSSDEAVDAIGSGAVDILCTPTPETLARRKSVSYSQPVYTAGLSVLVRKDAAPGLVDALNGEALHSGPIWRATINQGLAKHSFAALKGGVTEDWVRDRMRRLGVIATLVKVDSYEQGVQRVAEGKVSAFFGERMLLQHYLQRNPAAGQLEVLDRIFEIAPVSMALSRGDEDFRLLVDTVLSELYRSGELERLQTKYFGEPGEMARLLSRVYALP